MSQKTEKATPRRRKEARERGNVLKSADVGTAAVLLAVFAMLKLLGARVFAESSSMLQSWLTRLPGDGPLTVADAMKLITSAVLSIGTIGAPLVLAGLAAALASSVAQTGFLFTGKALQPKMSRINPIEGFKRIFSSRSLFELLKAAVKIAALGYAAYDEYRRILGQFPGFSMLDLAQAAALTADMAMNIALKMGLVLVGIAAADFFYQWWRRERDMRMTKQEIKQEFKESEGDPQIKSRIRQKQRQIGMQRMMQSVPSASVVITNPTHYAIALRYQEGRDSAPIVVAKGKDFLAQRIKEEARRHGVELVENRPLAQALYVYCDIGDTIPKDMYKAVAEVLAYVYRLKHPARPRERAAT